MVLTRRRAVISAALTALFLSLNSVVLAIDSQAQQFELEIVARGLDHPWGLAFLPDTRMLVSERSGNLRVVTPTGEVSEPLNGLPSLREVGQGGLMDVVLHPQFEHNQWIYLTYAGSGSGGHGTELMRAHFGTDGLTDVETIFRALPKFGGGRHFGSRLLFLPDGTLLLTLGDRGHRPNGQNLGTHPGSILRLNDDGSVPIDNPFVAFDGVRPEIYSFGHRNVQGIAIAAATGKVWSHEHGPQGGGEVNQLKPGLNYGWADITYGRNYVTGTRIGRGETSEQVAPPAYQWTPSIAPSGLAVYDGDKFPHWRGNLFAGSLKFRMLSRLVVDGDQIVHEERLLGDVLGRIRDVRQGPDGYLYLMTDSRDGVIARLRPPDD